MNEDDWDWDAETWDDLEQEITGCRFGEEGGCDHPDCHVEESNEKDHL